jgi:D-alanyl-D-alanine dipeptidase
MYVRLSGRSVPRTEHHWIGERGAADGFAAGAAAGLVDVRTVVRDAVIDLRYATVNNFVGVQLHPPQRTTHGHKGIRSSFGIVIGRTTCRSRCSRPYPTRTRWRAPVTTRAATSQDARSTSRWPTRTTGGHRLVTDFDDFSSRALAYATDGVTAQQQANRARLRDAMKAGGLTVYSGEWWHFDGPGADVPRPILDVPVK